MVKVAAFTRLALGQLRIARELVTESDEPVVAFEAPGVVLECAQIKAVETIGTALASEGGELQFTGPVFLAEKEAKGVFGIAGTAAVTAPDADARVDVKALGSIRINQFDGRRSFPVAAVIAGVGVDAGRRVKKVPQVGCYAVRGDGFEIVGELSAISGIVHNIRVHTVVNDVRAPTGGPTGRCFAVRRLAHYVAHENVRFGVRVGRQESVLEGSGANDGGAADRQRPRIDDAIRQRRYGAVRGVNNRRIGGGRGDRQTERRIIETAIRAELGVGDKGDEPAIV